MDKPLYLKCNNSEEKAIRINIFLTDDDKDHLRLYSSYFKSKGYNILATAQNGHETLQKLRELKVKPDLIIIDYNMPLMNGIEATKKILSLDKSYKILVMSSNPIIRKKALLAGATDFFFKMRGLKTLLQRVRNILMKD